MKNIKLRMFVLRPVTEEVVKVYIILGKSTEDVRKCLDDSCHVVMNSNSYEHQSCSTVMNIRVAVRHRSDQTKTRKTFRVRSNGPNNREAL